MTRIIALTTFFVQTQYAKDVVSDYEGRTDMLVISAGKRLGLSFDEMNELTTQDLIDLLHSTVSAAKKDGFTELSTESIRI